MILIRKVAEPFGFLGNMSPHPVLHEGVTWRTAEALFQALRFQDESIAKEIRDQKSPMGAKMLAKKNAAARVVVPMSRVDLMHMRLVLELKHTQHAFLEKALRETGTEEIIEDCSARPNTSGLFWGAALRDGAWVGENQLGKLWMEIRQRFS